MSRGVDEIEFELFSAFRRIGEADRLALNRDAAFAFQIHRIEELVAELAIGDAKRLLDDPIGECRFAVVDVGDDAEIADIFHFFTVRKTGGCRRWRRISRPCGQKIAAF